MRIPTLQLGMGWFPQQAGGLNRVYYNLMKYLPGVGVDVRGLVTGEKTQLEAEGIEFFAPTTAPLISRWKAARKSAKQLLESESFSIISSHFALYTFPSLDLIRSRPFVVHFHGPWASEGKVEKPGSRLDRIKMLLENTVYRRADRLIVLSRAFSKVLQTQFGITEDRIRIVPGGVDIRSFETTVSRCEARERLGWPVDRPILLTVRRLARRMGLENLVSAIEIVRRQVPEVLLYMAGTGPLAEELQRRVKAAGLENHVRFLGYVKEEQLPLVYRAADLSVVPTVTLEGFGLITVESLASGTPVLVTPVGGLPEVVRDLSPNLIFPDQRVEKMAEYLTGSLTGEFPLPDEAACRAYARSNFDWPVIASRTREIYEEVL